VYVRRGFYIFVCFHVSAEISVREMSNSLMPFGGGLRRVTSEPGTQGGQPGSLQHAGVPLLALDQTPESPD